MRHIRIVCQVIVIAAVVAACSGPTPALGPAGDPPPSTPTANQSPTTEGVGGQDPPSSDFIYGFNVFARADAEGEEFNRKVIEKVQDAGFSWVRIQLQWDEFERAKGQWDPVAIDRVVEQLGEAGIEILASVTDAPEWAIDPSGQQLLRDYGDFERFMRFVVDRYQGRIAAYQIWNEQNLASNMGGNVRLVDYCHLLEAGYQGAKAADPNVTIVFGSLTPNGISDPTIAIDDVQYLNEFYAYQGGYYSQFFDVLGMHANATNNPPDTLFPDNPGTGPWSNHPSFYFRRVEQLHQVMANHGDQRPAWITEFGWTTTNQAQGYEYGADNSEQDQADYLVRAFEIARNDWPWATGMFVWNLNYSTVAPPEDEKYPWSVLNGDWTPRPAYEKLKAMPKS